MAPVPAGAIFHTNARPKKRFLGWAADPTEENLNGKLFQHFISFIPFCGDQYQFYVDRGTVGLSFDYLRVFTQTPFTQKAEKRILGAASFYSETVSG